MENKYYLNERVIVKVGDITQENCDAIVNAANSSLLGGGGVDGAIHSAGGATILEECRQIRRESFPEGLPTGRAVMTNAGNLSSKNVIHTVGPVWHGGKSGESEKLRQCYESCLKIAYDQKFTSIAFPAISTGIYGYPLEKAAHVSSNTVKEFLAIHSFPEKIIFVFFSLADMQTFINHQQF